VKQRRRPRVNRVEQNMQIAVVKHLRTRGVPGLLYWHTPQGARYSSWVQGAIMNGLGTLAGVSDLLLLYQRKFYALELKAPGEKPDKNQTAFLEAFWRHGGYAEYADNIDRAIEVLEDWGLLRGKAQ
jgi:hypothetical protein